MDSAVMEFQERRTGIERRARVMRRTGEDRRVAAETERRSGKVKHTPLEVMGSVVAAALGLYVYKATGLYDATDSTVVALGLGAIIASWFVLHFRLGLHQR